MGNNVGGSPIQPEGVKMDGFVMSLDLDEHPMAAKGGKTGELYFAALEYLVDSCTPKVEEYAKAMLSQYRSVFLRGKDAAPPALEDGGAAVKKTVGDFLRPWKREYGSMLLCDVAFILLDRSAVEKACDMVSKYVNNRKRETLEESAGLLYGEREVPPALARTGRLIKQFRDNRKFAARPETRVMVTANMSAGKSTLINALIGKPIARMAQEACTANVCFLYNKPFEDNRVHLSASPLNLNAAGDDLRKVGKEASYNTSSYFRVCNDRGGGGGLRLCLIDTPGDNYSVDGGHGKLTRKAVKEERYDKLIYVLNANYLGTDDEIKHLRHIHKSVPDEKVVFVINKFDEYKPKVDSIPESVSRVRAELEKIGFKNPTICPISAHFSLLLKRKKFDKTQTLDGDEEDELEHYKKKFKKYNYNLSEYGGRVDGRKADADDFLTQCHRCGILGLENVLYGGV